VRKPKTKAAAKRKAQVKTLKTANDNVVLFPAA
jgi:hypothetical protein